MNPSPRRGLRWLPWLGAFFAIVGLVVFSVIFRVQENQAKVWPITRAVAARLATDEGARELYEKNPGLIAYYPTAEAFLASLRSSRAALGALPVKEPAKSSDGYDVDSNPLGFRIAIKGDGGGWLALEVQRSDGSEKGHAAIGEGITYAGFSKSADSPEELWDAANKARDEVEWSQYRAVAQALLTDDDTRRLLRDNPELASATGGESGFLPQVQAWRSRLGDPPAAVPQDGFRISNRDMLFAANHRELGWKLKDGAWLQITWENDHLAKISIQS